LGQDVCEVEMFENVTLSLSDLLGRDYVSAVSRAADILLEIDPKRVEELSDGPVDFFSSDFVSRLNELIDHVGKSIIDPVDFEMPGAPTDSFLKASNLNASPITGLGPFRLGEDGKLYLAAKSEHYHTPLGHNFPGYKLIDRARELGIVNATHNNTRGYITRLCEQELIRTANGIAKDNSKKLKEILSSTNPHILNRVINLETGSIACEAAIKMMLARFYRSDTSAATPLYEGKIPVLLVIGDFNDGRSANYHGTSVIAQTLRDMWPELNEKLEKNEILKICPVKINDIEDFIIKFDTYNRGQYKTAGFLHEIVLMNYGGIKLEKRYLQMTYEICHANDTPILCDEIQSCMWYDGMFLFKQYELSPDFVVVGKGFPGGQYPASRVLLTSEMDNLNQFGALVTNGQEELASLAYLITMAFVEQNGRPIRDISGYFLNKMKSLQNKYPSIVKQIEGEGLLCALTFDDVNLTKDFVRELNTEYIDISAQVYKANCPPAALLKLPVISTTKIVDWLTGKMESVLQRINVVL
jgi:acetylornithine/succinyldiaminopimelate/putrescine aminotransferase